MADSARLAKVALSAKPNGLQLAHFHVSGNAITEISLVVDDDIVETAYSAAISYAEAVAGLRRHQVAWSIIKLYYSAFYCLRAATLLHNVVPFNCGNEYLFDIKENKFLRGGRSSHQWNWSAFTKIAALRTSWPYSVDSENAYSQLREHRDNMNYRHKFPDPTLHQCLIAEESDIARRIRTYRDDSAFFYTYLQDHLSLSYPTKLLYFVEGEIANRGLVLAEEQVRHLKSLWPMRDRCPLIT
jgi:hypothetical protein